MTILEAIADSRDCVYDALLLCQGLQTRLDTTTAEAEDLRHVCHLLTDAVIALSQDACEASCKP